MRPIFYVLTFIVLASGRCHAEGGYLAIPNILGKQRLSKSVTAEVYANTKGELWYDIEINGREEGGRPIDAKTGKTTYFFWDDQKRQLWVLDDQRVECATYKVNDESESTTQELSDIGQLDPPPEVINLVEKLKEGE